MGALRGNSIDALATGIILPSAVGAYSLTLMLVSVGAIGLITFCIGFAGVFLGKTFGMLIAGKAGNSWRRCPGGHRVENFH